MPAWLHLTCFFGLPDDADPSQDIIVASIGPVLRGLGGHMASEPLPAAINDLLQRLANRESESPGLQRCRKSRPPLPEQKAPAAQPVVAASALKRGASLEQDVFELAE